MIAAPSLNHCKLLVPLGAILDWSVTGLLEHTTVPIGEVTVGDAGLEPVITTKLLLTCNGHNVDLTV